MKRIALLAAAVAQVVQASTVIEEAFDTLAEKDRIVVFTAVWCGPCQIQHRENDVLKKAGIPVVEIDVDKEPGLFNYCGGGMIPKIVILAGGKIAESYRGVTSANYLIGRWKDLHEQLPPQP